MPGAWLLAYKLQCYYALDYTSDIFVFVQLATSWLKGRFLFDNYYGDHRSIHTYFLAPLLALFVKPFGAPGLLIALAAAFSAGFAAAARILRLAGVPLPWAMVGGLLVSFMPLSVHHYQDETYGFHLELLMPAFGLWLGYFLLRRSWWGSLGAAAALLAIKEETPLVTAAIGGAIFCEELLRGLLRWDGARGWFRRHVNLPALTVVALALVALPLLLIFLKDHALGATSPGSFSRIKVPGGGITIDGPYVLFAYVHDDIETWLNSGETDLWYQLAFAGSFGLAVLRPHFLTLGVVTGLISWLARDNLTWAPRLSPSLAFFQFMTVFAFASLHHLLVRKRSPGKVVTPGNVVFALALLVLVVGGWRQQARHGPRAAEFYTLHPRHQLETTLRNEADRVYSAYLRDHRPGDVVYVNQFLFRYADASMDTYWLDRITSRPPATWVLKDFKQPVEKPVYEDFILVSHSGRFALFPAPPTRSPPR